MDFTILYNRYYYLTKSTYI